MAFLESAAANSADLLDEFMNFIVANNGFSRQPNLTVSGYITPIYVVSKGGLYWWFGVYQGTHQYYGTYGEIICKMMLVPPTTTNLLDQSIGQYHWTKVSLFNRPNGPYVGHRFYSDGQEAFCVLEITPGAYTHFGLGNITKYGVWTGGEFLQGVHFFIGFYSSWTAISSAMNSIDSLFPSDSTHRYIADTSSGFGHIYNPQRNLGNNQDFAPFLTGPIDFYCYKNHCMGSIPINNNGGGPNPYRYAIQYSKNNFNQRNIINGNLIYVNDSRIQDGTIRWIPAGCINTVRPISMDGLNPGDKVEVNWDVYPTVTKGGDSKTYPNTLNNGLAYKRII